ncbi:hypothetical protein LCAC16_80244 [Leuconostoc carnosum]|nr:hypothetical protein LCAC16_80244 [Leuconostoc carnosum]
MAISKKRLNTEHLGSNTVIIKFKYDYL